MTLLDTDSLSLLMNGHPRLTERVRNSEETVAIPIITRIEVLQGRFASILTASDGQRLLVAQEWLDRNEAYMATLDIVPIDAASANRFDDLRTQKKLKKIGRADLLIASIAIANRATLVSRNLKHFRQVPDLNVENWAD
ncbi:MAG: type II toxin-antitoxin system VapC family toxin [Planctomycetaceae bacterium]